MELIQMKKKQEIFAIIDKNISDHEVYQIDGDRLKRIIKKLINIILK